MKNDDQLFEVESPVDILAAIPPAILNPDVDLSPRARAVLVFAFTSPTQPGKAYLKLVCGLGESAWLLTCRELQTKGWLVRRNHGGGGRGVWRHERTFLRVPRKNPLLW